MEQPSTFRMPNGHTSGSPTSSDLKPSDSYSSNGTKGEFEETHGRSFTAIAGSSQTEYPATASRVMHSSLQPQPTVDAVEPDRRRSKWPGYPGPSPFLPSPATSSQNVSMTTNHRPFTPLAELAKRLRADHEEAWEVHEMLVASRASTEPASESEEMCAPVTDPQTTQSPSLLKHRDLEIGGEGSAKQYIDRWKDDAVLGGELSDLTCSSSSEEEGDSFDEGKTNPSTRLIPSGLP